MKFLLISFFMMLSLILKYTLTKNKKMLIFEYLGALLFFIVGLILIN